MIDKYNMKLNKDKTERGKDKSVIDNVIKN